MNSFRSISNSSLFLNLFTVGSASIFSKLVSLIVIGYPARILGPNNFGLVGFGTSLVAYAGILLIPGITSWGTREIARNKNKVGEIFITVSIIRIILAIITYFLLFVYCFSVITDSKQRTVVLLCGISVLSSSITIDWVFNGLELMRIPAIVTAFSSIFNVVLLFTFVQTPDDIYKYALIAPALTIFNVIGCFIFFFRRKVKLVMPPFSIFIKSIKAAFPLGVIMSIVVVLHYANNLIVKFYLGPESLGIFMSAFNLIELAATIPTILATVFLARLARVSLESHSLTKRDTRIYAQVHMIIGFFIATLFFAEAQSIIDLLYGNKYILSINLLRFMSVAIIFNYAIFGYTNCLISFGNDRVMLLVVVISAIVSVGGGLLLVPKFGLKGASIVLIFVDLLGWLVSLPYYKKIVGSFHFNIWIFPALGAITSIFVAIGLQIFGVPFWIRIILITICYVCFIYRDVNDTIQQHV